MELGEYLPALRTTNARMDDAAAEAVLAHGWAAPVPGCPDWHLADLIRHVAEVQHLWAWVVRTRATDLTGYPKPPTHPADELLGWLDAQHAELEAALAGADPELPVLLLAHQPHQVTGAVAHGVDLQISGHTHGGQMWPFHYLVRLDQPVLQGLSRHGERTQLYTSRGTGFWGPPFRIFAPSEITLLTLRAG
jgi:predicted MPP superfamily phosphohydrolase